MKLQKKSKSTPHIYLKGGRWKVTCNQINMNSSCAYYHCMKLNGEVGDGKLNFVEIRYDTFRQLYALSLFYIGGISGIKKNWYHQFSVFYGEQK